MHVRPSNVVQRGTELGATTGGNKDGFGSIQMKTSSFGKNMKASFEGGQIGNEVASPNSNVIRIEADVNLGGAGDHVMQHIHEKNEEGRRERATLFDTSMEVNTKGI